MITERQEYVSKYCEIERNRASIIARMKNEHVSLSRVMEMKVVQQDLTIVDVIVQVYKGNATIDEIHANCMRDK